MNTKHIFKLVVVGPQSSGKTTMIDRYVTGGLSISEPTIGVDFAFKRLQRQETQFQIWDTSGNPQFKAMALTYYKETHLFLICIDLTKPIEEAAPFIEEIKFNPKTPENAQFIVVGTKSNLAAKPEAAYSSDNSKQLSEIASYHQCQYVKITAKNITELEAALENFAIKQIAIKEAKTLTSLSNSQASAEGSTLNTALVIIGIALIIALLITFTVAVIMLGLANVFTSVPVIAVLAVEGGLLLIDMVVGLYQCSVSDTEPEPLLASSVSI